MNGDKNVYRILHELNISFDYLEHPPAPTIEIAKQYWAGTNAQHCKNLFFRNHKGNKHYLVIFDCDQQMGIHSIEQMLKQGKLSFASEERMMKYLGLKPGSVSPFGLIYDADSHVHVYIDETLKNAERLSFHPNDNTASLILTFSDFIKFLDSRKNVYEFIKLY
jgi:Ala-tRNA(Pro) deacylase